MQALEIDIDSKDGHRMDFVKMIGDIVFFKCPICDYERTLNIETGKLTRNKDSRIRHFGYTDECMLP